MTKQKCNECKKKSATSFMATKPLCTDCFVVHRFKRHPKRLQSYQRKQNVEGGNDKK